MEADVTADIAQLLSLWQTLKGMKVIIDCYNKVKVYTVFEKARMINKTLITYFLAVVRKCESILEHMKIR